MLSKFLFAKAELILVPLLGKARPHPLPDFPLALEQALQRVPADGFAKATFDLREQPRKVSGILVKPLQYLLLLEFVQSGFPPPPLAFQKSVDAALTPLVNPSRNGMKLRRPTQAELDCMSHAEKDALILKLFDVLEELEGRLKAVEEKVEKTSRNSSKPPSSDGLRKGAAEPRRRGEKPSGGQPGHPGATRRMVDEPDAVVELRPQGDCACGLALDGQEGVLRERRQQVEIPEPKTVVTEYRRMRVRCACGLEHSGAFPPGVTPDQLRPAPEGVCGGLGAGALCRVGADGRDHWRPVRRPAFRRRVAELGGGCRRAAGGGAGRGGPLRRERDAGQRGAALAPRRHDRDGGALHRASLARVTSVKVV
jgi:hypothetical protein